MARYLKSPRILTREPRYFLKHMQNYGALFPGPEKTWPTETASYQERTPEARLLIGDYCSRLCAIDEGVRQYGETVPRTSEGRS